MISEIILAINSFNMPVNFVTHLIIFVGTFYVVLHNHNLRQWHITPLWYLGLIHLFTAITVIIQWTLGPENPLSYWNMGLFGEALCNVALSAIVIIMFFFTVRQEWRESKKLKKQ